MKNNKKKEAFIKFLNEQNIKFVEKKVKWDDKTLEESWEKYSVIFLKIERLKEKFKKQNMKEGDVVKYTDEYGNFYPNARIDKIWEDGVVSLCENASCFINETGSEKGFYMIISGGAFKFLAPEKVKEIKLLGTKKARFWTWLDYPRANGGIYFDSDVNYYEYKADPELEFTEEHYKKVHYSLPKPGIHSEYAFLSNGYSEKEKKDLLLKMQTFRGVAVKGYNDSDIIVWYWKHFEQQVGIRELEELKRMPGAVLDTTKANGLRECVRFYKEEDKTVHTYYSFKTDELDWDKEKRILLQNRSLYEYAEKHKEEEYLYVRKNNKKGDEEIWKIL